MVVASFLIPVLYDAWNNRIAALRRTIVGRISEGITSAVDAVSPRKVIFAGTSPDCAQQVSWSETTYQRSVDPDLGRGSSSVVLK